MPAIANPPGTAWFIHDPADPKTDGVANDDDRIISPPVAVRKLAQMGPGKGKNMTAAGLIKGPSPTDEDVGFEIIPVG